MSGVVVQFYIFIFTRKTHNYIDEATTVFYVVSYDSFR